MEQSRRRVREICNSLVGEISLAPSREGSDCIRKANLAGVVVDLERNRWRDLSDLGARDFSATRVVLAGCQASVNRASLASLHINLDNVQSKDPSVCGRECSTASCILAIGNFSSTGDKWRNQGGVILAMDNHQLYEPTFFWENERDFRWDY